MPHRSPNRPVPPCALAAAAEEPELEDSGARELLLDGSSGQNLGTWEVGPRPTLRRYGPAAVLGVVGAGLLVAIGGRLTGRAALSSSKGFLELQASGQAAEPGSTNCEALPPCGPGTVNPDCEAKVRSWGSSICRLNAADTSDDARGTAKVMHGIDLALCKALCITEASCTGFEHETLAKRCELWTIPICTHETPLPGMQTDFQCFVKVGALLQFEEPIVVATPPKPAVRVPVPAEDKRNDVSEKAIKKNMQEMEKEEATEEKQKEAAEKAIAERLKEAVQEEKKNKSTTAAPKKEDPQVAAAEEAIKEKLQEVEKEEATEEKQKEAAEKAIAERLKEAEIEEAAAKAGAA